MGDVGDYWRDHREHVREKRAKNGKRGMPLIMSGWTQHTEYHFSGVLDGKRIDYWPTRNKFMLDGKVMYGDIDGFIRKRDKSKPTSDIAF